MKSWNAWTRHRETAVDKSLHGVQTQVVVITAETDGVDEVMKLPRLDSDGEVVGCAKMAQRTR